jgi:hypothetical protein
MSIIAWAAQRVAGYVEEQRPAPPDAVVVSRWGRIRVIAPHREISAADAALWVLVDDMLADDRELTVLAEVFGVLTPGEFR